MSSVQPEGTQSVQSTPSPRKLSSWTIRAKLLLLLLIVFIPASGIIIASGIEHRIHGIEAGRNSAMLLVESLAAQQEQIAVGTKQMLSTLALLPQVQSRDTGACNMLFRELKDRHPFYSTIGAVTPDGNMFANANAFEPGRMNISNQKHIRDTLESLDFSAGEFIVGRLTKIPTIHYSYPVFDSSGSLSAIVVAGFKLDEYARFIEKANLPEGSAVVIADHSGVRLYRVPENGAAAAGTPMPGNAFNKMSGTAEKGTFERAGADGVKRIYAFRRLHLKEGLPPYLYIAAGVPKDAILQRATGEMIRNLSLLGTIAVGAAALAWFFGNRFLAEPISQLAGATKRLAGGEMEARAGLPHTHDELGQLASSFDEMASLLERRSIERDKSAEALLEATQRLQFATTSGKLGVWDWHMLSDTLSWNEQMFELYGICNESSPRSSEAWQKLLHPDDLTRASEAAQAAIQGKRKYDTEFRIVRPDGAVRVLKADAIVIRDGTGKPVRMIGLNRDITERKKAEEALRQFPSRILAAHEEERKRIAHELHDSIGGSLGAIKLGLEHTLKLMEQGMATAEGIEEIAEMTARTIEEARRIYMNLRPSILDDLGLTATISWFCRQFETVHSSIRIDRQVEAQEESIPEDLKIVIFRVMQEAFHNIAKYSKADLVTLSLRRNHLSIELAIEDNGVGFHVDHSNSLRSEKGGLGLTSMRERVELSKGVFSIESGPGHGAIIRAMWPHDSA